MKKLKNKVKKSALQVHYNKKIPSISMKGLLINNQRLPDDDEFVLRFIKLS